MTILRSVASSGFAASVAKRSQSLAFTLEDHMAYVRMLVQQCEPGTIEMLTDKAEETLVPRLRQMRGFISYQIVKVDERTLLAIASFETREGAEEVERIGVEWRKRYGTDAIVSFQPYIGEVILEAKGFASEVRPVL